MINNILKTLLSPSTPKQTALGIALGSIIALTPLLTLHNFIILFLIFILSVNFRSAILTAFLLTPLGFALTPLFLLIGEHLLLHQPALVPLWEKLQRIPLLPLFQFNNTLVLGSFILAVLLSVPIAWTSNYLIKLYQNRWREKFSKTKLYGSLSEAKFLSWAKNSLWLQKFSTRPPLDIYKQQKNIRWGGLIPFFMLLIVGGVFSLLFLEPLLKFQIKRYVEKINQAPVEIGELDLQLTKLGASINSIKFANKNNLKENLFQVENLSFNLEPSPLFFGKFHIEQAKVVGLELRTPRDVESLQPVESNNNSLEKNSPAAKVSDTKAKEKKILPPKKTAKEITSLSTTKTTPPKSDVASIDVEAILSSNNVDLEKKINDFKNQVDDKTDDLEKKIESVLDLSELKEKYSNVQFATNSTEQSSDSNGLSQTNLQKIEDLKKTFDDKKETLAKMKSELKTNQEQLQKKYRQLLKQKDNHLKKLLESFNRDNPEVKSITDLILREVIHREVKQYFFYYQNYRQHLLDFSPSFQAKVSRQKKRGGLTVDFLGEKSTPIFWIKQTTIFGKVTPAFFVEGELLNFSSDLSYSPMTVSLTGRDGNADLKLFSYFEKNTDTQKISNKTTIDWKNYDLREAHWITQSPYIKKVNQGVTDMLVELQDDGEALKLEGRITGKNISLKVGAVDDVIKPILQNALKRIPLLKVTFEFLAWHENGVIKRSKLSLNSNFDDILKSKLKQYFDKKNNKERKELIAAYNKKIKKVLAPIDEKLGTKLNEKINQGVVDLNAWQGDIEKIQNHLLKELKKKDVQENIKKEIDKYLPKETADEVKDFLKKNFF